MNCVICKTGKTCPGYATVMLTRAGSTVIIKQVPADICDNCGEYYLSSDMTDRVLLWPKLPCVKGLKSSSLAGRHRLRQMHAKLDRSHTPAWKCGFGRSGVSMGG